MKKICSRVTFIGLLGCMVISATAMASSENLVCRTWNEYTDTNGVKNMSKEVVASKVKINQGKTETQWSDLGLTYVVRLHNSSDSTILVYDEKSQQLLGFSTGGLAPSPKNPVIPHSIGLRVKVSPIDVGNGNHVGLANVDCFRCAATSNHSECN